MERKKEKENIYYIILLIFFGVSGMGFMFFGYITFDMAINLAVDNIISERNNWTISETGLVISGILTVLSLISLLLIAFLVKEKTINSK